VILLKWPQLDEFLSDFNSDFGNRFKMHEWTEEDMQRALQMVADGHSLRKAAAANGIGKSTLQGRINGATMRQEA
jgi:lambda repressor-like predicted transcriptional regulator